MCRRACFDIYIQSTSSDPGPSLLFLQKYPSSVFDGSTSASWDGHPCEGVRALILYPIHGKWASIESPNRHFLQEKRFYLLSISPPYVGVCASIFISNLSLLVRPSIPSLQKKFLQNKRSYLKHSWLSVCRRVCFNIYIQSTASDLGLIVLSLQKSFAIRDPIMNPSNPNHPSNQAKISYVCLNSTSNGTKPKLQKWSQPTNW